MSSNPAALQGWVKSTDPKSGRVFYANHITRKTQWDPPADWVDEPPAPAPSHFSGKEEKEESPLPSNWEEMHDPTTGKPFYVDHERKITTWTRPTAATTTAAMPKSHASASAVAGSLRWTNPNTTQATAPAPAPVARTTHTSSAYATEAHSAAMPSSSSYLQEASYFTASATPSSFADAVDLSDSLPPLEFKVSTVPDALRPSCPHCQALFSVSKRRHHCRLCGDVFCDACSSHRVELPLEGAEFQRGPVRICDFCNEDVQGGNFFSMRRYLTPLHLYNPDNPNANKDGKDQGAASASNVNAALSGLTVDLDQWVQTGTPTLDKVTIPADILIPEIAKHLHAPDTCYRSVVCLASLMALENMAGATIHAVELYKLANGITPKQADGTSHASPKSPLEAFAKVLERSGSDRKTLYVQEQTVRIIYYLTETKTVQAALQTNFLGGGSDDEANERTLVDAMDLSRIVKSLLDHASASSKNPNLQRWSAACIKNLVLEDQRRATGAINNVAASMALSGGSNLTPSYESFLPELIATGGIMMLCTLIGTDDADTRAHAVGALGATLACTRAVDAAKIALAEMTGGNASHIATKDGDIVRAIVAGGGCASSVSQLLLSADNSVAGMGCAFLSSLVMPLLSDPHASMSLPSNYDYRNDQSGVGACREAAVEIATDSCLPALLSLVRENNGRTSRPIELRKLAMETLAAVTMSVGEMGKAWARGQYEEGLQRSGAPTKLKDAIVMINEEGVIDGALEVLQSSVGQSLGSSRETHASRLREAAGIVLASLTSCSAEAIMELQTRQILSAMLLSSNDSSMTVQSTLRGDAAPRCLGVLETVASIIMFAWQHPSGASSELLDRLIEMVDAGVIPYLSKVMNSKIDWESKDKAVGAMMARTASCKLLSCLFGVALNDDTGIGMRRLMDAVDADSRAYRGGERSPNDLIEATLAILQASSNLARRAMMGSLNQGPHYQTALMDLVDASLLAAGSMCGSSVAPGGSEGTMVTGESFLSARSDQYVGKRKGICRVACDVIVRGGRSGPSLLPTMLVGGFGEGCVLSSLRLALAIGQNGSPDEHAKLALSGILVPISDSLRTALSGGDLYRFSASLAMVRFCGPHIAAGQGGGLESVRDAIRVATSVLTLPVNPDASLEQMETQDLLKSECVAALEALSRNASLWSAISREALPSIVQYLHATADLPSVGNPRRQATRCTALRAVRQIVQVPSHAVSAAESGIVEPLGKLLKSGAKTAFQDDEVPMLALEVLHVIASNKQARQKAQFLTTGLAQSICAALGKAATDDPKQPSDSRADVTLLGLEILHSVLSDVEGDLDMQFVLQSSEAIAFLDAIASEPQFLKALCSTLLVTTNMRLPRHDGDQSGEAVFDIPTLYGPPLLQVTSKCAGFAGTHEAAASIFYTASVYACAIDSCRSDAFWKTVLMQGSDERVEASRLAATLCAHFLALLTVDYTPFLPLDQRKQQDYLTITRPLIRYRLLDALKDLMEELSNGSAYGDTSDPYVTSLLVGFNVPHICLSLWKDPAILDLAFGLIKHIVEQDPDEVLHLFVEGKDAIMSLFDLLNLDSSIETSNNIGEIRRFLASVLGQLAETGLLADAVKKYDVRSNAIEALAAACLGEEERPADEDEDTTSARLSTVLMRCLVDLCTIKTRGIVQEKRIQLSAAEAESIAKNLGKKICHMVLSRFLERAKLQQYEIEDDEVIMDAPDVGMLCAIAQHEDALFVLRAAGGLHALSLVAAEGELSAMVALKKACKSDATVLLEGETYKSLLKLLIDEDRQVPEFRELHSNAFELLARLCADSAKGRRLVAEAETCQDCIHRSMEIICILAGEYTPPENTVESDTDEEEDEEVVEDDAEEEPEEGGKLDPPPYEVLASATALPPSPVQKAPSNPSELEIGACSFLTSLITMPICRDALMDNKNCINSLSAIVTGEGEQKEVIAAGGPELKSAALKVLTVLAPYTSSERALSSEALADVLLSILTAELKMPAKAGLNANFIYRNTLAGLNVIFDSVDDDKQKLIADSVAKRYRKSVKLASITRATTKEAERAFSAELVYEMTNTLILCRGKVFADVSVFTQDLLTSIVHLVQWRCDPKTSVGKTDPRSWDGAVFQSLMLLSFAIWRPDAVLDANGIKLTELASTTLMLARPGKAPRKAIDFQSALERMVAKEEDGAAALGLTAQRILDRLY